MYKPHRKLIWIGFLSTDRFFTERGVPMIWPTYEVRGRHKETHRIRTIRITTMSLEDCKVKAFEQGLMEPLEIMEMPPDKPSERQIEYAVNVGYKVTPEMSVRDVSALLDRYENADSSDPNPELLEYANDKSFNFSNYVGKKALYNIIFDNLIGREKTAFFIFCVYRWLSDDRKANLDKHPYRDRFFGMADILTGNDQFEKSMNKYCGEDIRFFGELIVRNNSSFGGSVNTIAYKTVAEMLSKEFGLNNQIVKTIHKYNEDRKYLKPLRLNNEHKGIIQSIFSLFFKTN